MSTYWRDKKGIKEALVDYYPETLKDDMSLKQALAQLENAERDSALARVRVGRSRHDGFRNSMTID